MTEVLLRVATSADVPRLTELVQAAYGHYVDRLGGPPRPMTDDYTEIVRRDQVFVAEQAHRIVGLLVLEHGDVGLVIDNVAVDPSHQGSGIGRALLQHAEATARAEASDWIYLYTHELMTENQALYSRIGYTEYDRRQQGTARLVYMRKNLGDATPGQGRDE